jgi:hypothetical protein
MALQNLDKHKPDNNVQYVAVSCVYSSQKCMELALYLWERQGCAAQDRLDEGACECYSQTQNLLTTGHETVGV